MFTFAAGKYTVALTECKSDEGEPGNISLGDASPKIYAIASMEHNYVKWISDLVRLVGFSSFEKFRKFHNKFPPRHSEPTPSHEKFSIKYEMDELDIKFEFVLRKKIIDVNETLAIQSRQIEDLSNQVKVLTYARRKYAPDELISLSDVCINVKYSPQTGCYLDVDEYKRHPLANMENYEMLRELLYEVMLADDEKHQYMKFKSLEEIFSDFTKDCAIPVTCEPFVYKGELQKLLEATYEVSDGIALSVVNKGHYSTPYMKIESALHRVNAQAQPNPIANPLEHFYFKSGFTEDITIGKYAIPYRSLLKQDGPISKKTVVELMNTGFKRPFYHFCIRAPKSCMLYFDH